MIPTSSARAAIPSKSRYESPSRNNVPDNAISNSSIRPRNRRLVSTEQELVSTSATSTPAGSRAVSPIPARHPSRSISRTENSLNGNRNRPVGGLLAPPGEGGGGAGSPIVSTGGIWESGWMSSWTTLQGIANTVLGGTEGSEVPPSVDSLGRRTRRRRISSGSRSSISSKWGPDTHLPKQNDGGIGMGSASERESALIAKKRQRILEGRDEDLKTTVDTNGNYKRRTSVEETRLKSPSEEDQALVYVHHVEKQDTLQGVVLKYNCKPEVFRKANRFWPNDSIQMRETVVLPVEACAVKGRPCDPPSFDSPYQGVDLLAPTPNFEDPPLNDGSSWPGVTPQNGMSAEHPEDAANPWVHVRWVLIDSSPNSKPIEIARMPRKTLGYFPPRRRKSIASLSTASTPRGSADFARLSQSLSHASSDPINSTANTPVRKLSNLGARPSLSSSTIGSYFPPITSSTLTRQEIVKEAADRPRWMRGPGGVGTLGKNVRKPGPGQDGLNSWAKKHIPGLAIDSLPSSSVLGTTTAHFGFKEDLASIAEGGYNAGTSSTGTHTPSAGGQGLSFEQAASAVEGWVRKLALKAPGTPKNGGRIDNSDLIELLDGTGSDDGRGFELSPGRGRSVSGTGREDLESVVRGRQSAGVKGGKSD